MSIPRGIDACIKEYGTPSNNDVPATEMECEGARHHSPNPLVIHEVVISPSGRGETAMLCGTCLDNLRVYHHLQARHGEVALDWEVRREFGNTLRAIAMRGWTGQEVEEEEET